jgi:poly(hydroxyalkanoate) depolymerase family esterase
MRSLSDTLERLKRFRTISAATPPSHRLKRLGSFQNPGGLVGWYHVPEGSPHPVPLVVVLHGCTQTAAGYDGGSGWSRLADDFGFAVLFPEQSRQNNPNLCFNWFVDSDVERDHGEVASIRAMIAAMTASHGIDPSRIYITGLSAGGAMANAMLSCYPEVFAGGAIIAGLPYGVASTIPEAFDRMRGQGLPSPERLRDRLRSASSHTGPWPTISVWHGTADHTVAEVNALAIVDQWRAVHDVSADPTRYDVADGVEHRVWMDASGMSAIEFYRIAGMGHGTPIDVTSGYGTAAPYMLDIGVSSTELVARSWGLIPSFERRTQLRGEQNVISEPKANSQPTSDVQTVIEHALRAAGLLK